jgi:hypothetical protein
VTFRMALMSLTLGQFSKISEPIEQVVIALSWANKI